MPEGTTHNRPSRPEAGVHLRGLGLPDTQTLAVRQTFEMQVEHDIVDAKAYFARYRPSKEVCRKAAGGLDFKHAGFERLRFWLPSEASAPRLLYL